MNNNQQTILFYVLVNNNQQTILINVLVNNNQQTILINIVENNEYYEHSYSGIKDIQSQLIY